MWIDHWKARLVASINGELGMRLFKVVGGLGCMRLNMLLIERFLGDRAICALSVEYHMPHLGY